MRPAACPCKLVLLASLLGSSLSAARTDAAGAAPAEPTSRAPAPAVQSRHGDSPDPLHIADPHLVFGFAPPAASPSRPVLPAPAVAGASAAARGHAAEAHHGWLHAEPSPTPGPTQAQAQAQAQTQAQAQAQTQTQTQTQTQAPTPQRRADAAPLAAASVRRPGASVEELLGLQDQAALRALQRALGFAAPAQALPEAPATVDESAARVMPDAPIEPGARTPTAEPVVAPTASFTAPEPASVAAPEPGSGPGPAPLVALPPSRPDPQPAPSPAPVAIVLRGPAERTAALKPIARATVDEIDGPPPAPAEASDAIDTLASVDDASDPVDGAPDPAVSPDVDIAVDVAVETEPAVETDTVIAAASDPETSRSATGAVSTLLGSGPVALADDRLDRVRGGFVTPTGLQVSFGIERAVYVNGTLVANTTLNVTGMGSGSRPTVQFASGHGVGAGLTVIQNGGGNTFSSHPVSGSTLGTVVQNTLNDQKIQSITMINATVNSLQVLRAQNLSSSLRGAVTDSLRR